MDGRKNEYESLEIWLEDVDWIVWLVIVTVAGFCEHGSEHSGPAMYGID